MLSLSWGLGLTPSPNDLRACAAPDPGPRNLGLLVTQGAKQGAKQDATLAYFLLLPATRLKEGAADRDAAPTVVLGADTDLVLWAMCLAPDADLGQTLSFALQQFQREAFPSRVVLVRFSSTPETEPGLRAAGFEGRGPVLTLLVASFAVEQKFRLPGDHYLIRGRADAARPHERTGCVYGGAGSVGFWYDGVLYFELEDESTEVTLTLTGYCGPFQHVLPLAKEAAFLSGAHTLRLRPDIVPESLSLPSLGFEGLELDLTSWRARTERKLGRVYSALCETNRDADAELRALVDGASASQLRKFLREQGRDQGPDDAGDAAAVLAALQQEARQFCGKSSDEHHGQLTLGLAFSRIVRDDDGAKPSWLRSKLADWAASVLSALWTTLAPVLNLAGKGVKIVGKMLLTVKQVCASGSLLEAGARSAACVSAARFLCTALEWVRMELVSFAALNFGAVSPAVTQAVNLVWYGFSKLCNYLGTVDGRASVAVPSEFRNTGKSETFTVPAQVAESFRTDALTELWQGQVMNSALSACEFDRWASFGDKRYSSEDNCVRHLTSVLQQGTGAILI